MPDVLEKQAATPATPYDEETAFALDWAEIRGRLERLHHVKLPEDDPLLMTGEAFLLAWEKTGRQMAAAVTNHLKKSLASFANELDSSTKERREEAHRDIMALSAIARGELNAATKQSLTEIKTATSELLQAAKELKWQDRSMRWHDWFIGALVMCVVLALGVAVGRYLWH
jgi:hypothetical protein